MGDLKGDSHLFLEGIYRGRYTKVVEGRPYIVIAKQLNRRGLTCVWPCNVRKCIMSHTA